MNMTAMQTKFVTATLIGESISNWQGSPGYEFRYVLCYTTAPAPGAHSLQPENTSRRIVGPMHELSAGVAVLVTHVLCRVLPDGRLQPLELTPPSSVTRANSERQAEYESFRANEMQVADWPTKLFSFDVYPITEPDLLNQPKATP